MSMQRLVNRLARLKSAPHCLLPRLLVLSDAARGFDLNVQHTKWPRGAGFIERTYGAIPSEVPAQRRPAMQLATCTSKQARRAGLNGVHWPHARLPLRRRSQMAGLLETASAHRGLEIAKALHMGIACVLVSPAFASESPSAGKALGPHRLAKLARAFPRCDLFALGGMTEERVGTLSRSGLYGVALVSFTRKQTRN
jgi:thiamine-phosphate pyrophosphorylase